MSDLPATRAESDRLIAVAESEYEKCPEPRADARAFIALARLGAQCIGATEAWCAVGPKSGEPWFISSRKVEAEHEAGRWLEVSNQVRRVLILPEQPYADPQAKELDALFGDALRLTKKAVGGEQS